MVLASSQRSPRKSLPFPFLLKCRKAKRHRSQHHSGAPKAPASSKLPPGPGLEAWLEFTPTGGLREGSSRAAGLCLPVFDNSGHSVSKNTSKQEPFPEGALALGTSGSFRLGWPRAASVEGRWEGGRAVRPAGALHASLSPLPQPSSPRKRGLHPASTSQRALCRQPTGPARQPCRQPRRLCQESVNGRHRSWQPEPAPLKPLPSEAICLLDEGVVWLRGTRSNPSEGHAAVMGPQRGDRLHLWCA